MIQHWNIRYRGAVALVALVALALISAAALVGCGDKKEEQQPVGKTAKQGLAAARSALSTMAPDGKLLVVQTAAAVTPTSTPVWAYLFGSPKTDTVYVVYVQNGQPMGASQYGTGGLTAAQWAKVPSSDEWKVDSDEALRKALEESGAEGTPSGYVMGFVTFVPTQSGTQTVEPFVWNVSFDPGTSGAATGTIAVDARTGETKVLDK